MDTVLDSPGIVKRLVKMIKIISLILLMGMIFIPTGLSVDYINSYCTNITTKQVTITNWNGSANNTALVTNNICPFGCDVIYGTCYTEGIFIYQAIFIVAIILVILASLWLHKMLKKPENEEGEGQGNLNAGLRLLFLLMALFFEYILFIQLGTYSSFLKNTAIENAGTSALGISSSLFWVFFIVLVLTVVFYGLDLLAGIANKFRRKKKPRQEVRLSQE